MKEEMKKEQLPKEEARREFLVKAGKFAIYTPPALMLLMHPSKNALARSYRGERTPRRPPWDGQGPGPDYRPPRRPKRRPKRPRPPKRRPPRRPPVDLN